MKDDFMPLGFLPNVEGFEFVGKTKEGELMNCVVKLVDGMHSAYSAGKPCFKQLRSWRSK